MKKIAIVALAGLIAASLLGGTATAAKKKKPVKKGPPQVVEGGIRMRAPYPPGNAEPLDSCYSGLHRRGAVATGEQNNGIVGFHFDLNPKSVGQKFVLEPTGGQGTVDLDITFYTEFGTPEQAADTQYAPVNQSFEERGAGGEKGKVPVGMKKAIICMYDGADATFKYTAATKK